MKIELSKIPPEGLTLEENILPLELNLETDIDIVEFPEPIKVRAHIYKITNTVSVHLEFNTLMHTRCSRCLEESKIDFKKELNLNYPVDKFTQVIELNPDIREEIILDYPLKPLCQPDCKGLCPKCGKNLNQGDCSCAIT